MVNSSRLCEPGGRTGFSVCGKNANVFCHSERSEESFFLFLGLSRGEIPCFARNDKIYYLFRSQFSLSY
jgi:hypothetical protein